MRLTDEQFAIVDFVREGRGDLLIEALAGSGKTSTLLEALKVIPQRSILVCAFNKGIAENLKAKLPVLPKTHVVHVKTFHALGLSIIHAHYPKLKVDKGASEALINKAAGENTRLPYAIRRSALRLLRTTKEIEVIDGITIGARSSRMQELEQIGHQHNLFGRLTGPQIDHVCALVSVAYTAGMKPESLEAIDFCDMIWMPLALGLSCPSRYQAIIVDEWQDLSEPQFELIRRLRAPNGSRMIMAGDIRQAVYGWRGAVGETVRSAMIDQQHATTLPLTTSFRCSKAVITEAQQLVPEIKACAEADDGTITNIELVDMPRMMMGGYSDEIHTFVLSRTNADLLDCALFLWREGVRFQLNAGESLLEPLFDLLDALDTRTPDLFRKSLNTWHAEETTKADAINATAWRERIDEQRLMLLRAVSHSKPSGIKALFSSILKPGKTGVLLSTVHKVKGLEAERVFLLRDTFARHVIPQAVEAFVAGAVVEPRTFFLNERHEQQDPGGTLPSVSPGATTIQLPNGRTIALGDWIDDRTYETIGFKSGPSQEELNLEYVAITRAREHLIWVTMRPWDNDGHIKMGTFDMMVEVCRQSDLSNVDDASIERMQTAIADEAVRLATLGKLEKSDDLAKIAVRLKERKAR